MVSELQGLLLCSTISSVDGVWVHTCAQMPEEAPSAGVTAGCEYPVWVLGT